MKYKEILELYDYFQPTYDITNEKQDYWKQFIPTQDFMEILKTLLNSLEANNPKEKKSLWIQGVYGTGKSHATGVIKHLLSDPLESISDFIEKIPNAQLVAHLRNFREENRVFPVAIKGLSGIYDHKTLKLTIEKNLKDALKKEGIKLVTKDEFQKYIELIDNAYYISWDQIVEGNPQLKSIVKDKAGLLKRLENYDYEVLLQLENCFQNIAILMPTIEEWLSKVMNELKGKYDYSHIVIYWDEFTSVLELNETSGILNIIQSIAEKTADTDVFLFIVSHRHPLQTKILKEDIEKILGRFSYRDYKMENITTYHVISNSIRKKDFEKWKSLRDDLFDLKFENLLWKLIDISDTKSKETLKNVFPLHPYTAFLANKISEFVGSASRSIFSFLYDEEKGFLRFIEEYPIQTNGTKDYFLTADWLWEYFYQEFAKNLEDRFYAVMEKSKLLDIIKKQGKNYEAIYKGILLLNILTSYTDISRGTNEAYLPSRDNIKGMFLGTSFESEVDNILGYIDENGYISKGPNELFLVFLNLPNIKELEAEKIKVQRDFSDITNALTEENKSDLIDFITKNILRDCESEVFGGNLQKADIKIKLQKLFKESHTLKMAIFVCKDDIERENLKKEIKELNSNENFSDKGIIIVFDSVLGERNFERLIDYQARINIVRKSTNRDEEATLKIYLKDLLSKWINEIKTGSCEIFYKDQKLKILVRDIESKINSEISQKYFIVGPENLNELNTNINIWRRSSNTIIDSFIFAQNLNDLEEKIKGNPQSLLKGILKSNIGSYIVDKNLNFIQDIHLHPTMRIFNEIKSRIEAKENSVFNLADEFDFLRYPPYGLCTNMISAAIIAFSMRPYVNKLYEENTGIKITKDLMRDKVSLLLSYWRNGRNKEKLNLRLGTQEEGELVEILAEIFKLNAEANLNKIKWGIREWVKNIGYPIWSLKYYKKEKTYEEVSMIIIYLITTLDKDIAQEKIKVILNFLKNKKTDVILSIEKENFKKGFINWIQETENLSIDESDLQEAMNYLKLNMQDEVGLWTEEKVQLKLQEWINKKRLDRLEADLINTLEEVFNIENSKNINELKQKIINSINTQIRFPLWVFKYASEKEEALSEAFESIQSILKSELKLAEDVLLNFLTNIKIRKTHLIKFLNEENAKLCAINWAKEKEIEYPNEFIEYVNKNLRLSPYQCSEKDFLDFKNEFLFVKYLSKAFNLFNISSLKELQEGLKNYFSKLGIPFWIFKYDKEAENIKGLLEMVDIFINGNKIQYENLRDLKNIIFINGEKIGELINNLKGYSLFKRWLNNKLNFEINNIEKIIHQMKENIIIDEFIWNEDKAEIWLYNNLKSLIDENKKELCKRKILSCNEDLREILIKIIDENPELTVIIDKYL